MSHIDEADLSEAVRDALRDYHDEATVEGDGYEYVRGGRRADLTIQDRPRNQRDIAVEVENSVSTGDLRDGVAQAEHYRRAGYVPVVALPLILSDLPDPDTRSGEVLNIAAESRLGLMGVWFEDDEDTEGAEVTGASYVLRPFE